jgi:hypothetical protein
VLVAGQRGLQRPRPDPAALTPTAATSSTATSRPNWIVFGAASSENWSISGSSSAILPTSSSATAAAPPSAPSSTPSMTNGQRMNQSVAPTSFMTSTSRRREKSESRMVFAISIVEAARRIPLPTRKMSSSTFANVSTRFVFLLP